MELEGKSSTEQVTALIVFEVKPERMNDFEEWIKGIHQVVKGFEGYLGVDIIRPRDHVHSEYVIVLRFDQYDHLRAWMGSLQREEWLKKSEEMRVGELKIQEAHGFDPWFTLPDHIHTTVVPAKYKMALLTIMALYLPLLALSTLLSYSLRGWPRALIILLTVLILVPTMTYFIMPWVTQLFRSWLYPKA
jgi:antibiotic biosynthesis monooxygenase (ABM) superfamily enzyme